MAIDNPRDKTVADLMACDVTELALRAEAEIYKLESLDLDLTSGAVARIGVALVLRMLRALESRQ